MRCLSGFELYFRWVPLRFVLNVKLNLSTTATLGEEERGILERLKQESVYGLRIKQSGRCREVAVSGGSTVLYKQFWFLHK